MNLLKINNLEAFIDNVQILKNLNLKIGKNEIHVIMGPNGSGKSTLSKILAGHPAYSNIKGNVEFKGKNLLDMDPEKRSHEGLFLAFQYPLEITGVSNYDFLRIAYNEKQKFKNESELDPLQFMELIQKLLNKLKMKSEFLNRDLNEGFSGGEKKRNEILQMLLLKPDLVILDEIDSGLDIDAIKIICEGIKNNLEKEASILLITHYPRILDILEPTHVHIMIDGNIVKTGNLELVEELEKKGYEPFFSNLTIIN
jgi:Fe-S cluster assembly ATP-binding protein